jgi:hypothetical protein
MKSKKKKLTKQRNEILSSSDTLNALPGENLLLRLNNLTTLLLHNLEPMPNLLHPLVRHVLGDIERNEAQKDGQRPADDDVHHRRFLLGTTRAEHDREGVAEFAPVAFDCAEIIAESGWRRRVE